jgi:glycosyltransferase involved in cell wall biosynthesis
MIRHHLALADEIIVHDGMSDDGTFEAISSIDPKVRVIRSDWGAPSGFDWITSFKNRARNEARGRWCINIDCDEFIPEWEFESLRAYIEDCKFDVCSLRQVNFYGNYRVFHAHPARVPWPDIKNNIHRNLPYIQVVGDGSNVESVDPTKTMSVDPDVRFDCHHFGFVRNPARLRQKWRNVLGNIYSSSFGGKRKLFKLPSFLFDLWPHSWLDEQFLSDLEIYDGPYIRTVLDNPAEFTRDKMQTLSYLRKIAGTKVVR